MENFQILAERIYPLNRKGTIRVNLSLGLGFTIIREPTNWKPLGGSLFIAPNYSYDYNEYNTLDIIINPKIKFSITRFYGLSLSPMIQINKDRTYIGIGQMIGLLRKKSIENVEEKN